MIGWVGTPKRGERWACCKVGSDSVSGDRGNYKRLMMGPSFALLTRA